MLKVRAHTCYLGTTGYTSHARSFFREFSKYVNLRIRNYTWDDNPEYLDELDFSLIDTITLLTESGKKDFHISHGFPNLPWKNHTESFIPDVDIVLMDMNSEYFYEKYSAPVKIAYAVWESTKLLESFFNQLLKFDYLWVVSDWHKKVVDKSLKRKGIFTYFDPKGKDKYRYGDLLNLDLVKIISEIPKNNYHNDNDCFCPYIINV
jgi:hypothetical protein